MRKSVLTAVVLGLVAAPAAAPAATVHIQYSSVQFQGAAGERNAVTVNYADATRSTVYVRDAAATLHAGDGCTAVDAHTAQCSLPSGHGALNSVTAHLGDGHDTATVDLPGGSSYLFGEDGNDTLTGAEAIGILGGADSLTGGGGNDRLVGRSGNDQLDRYGFDRSAQQEGADEYVGGAGRDEVMYDQRTAPIRVTLAGGADDGEAGEGDNVHADIEVVTAGQAADVLVGAAGDDELHGGDGNDRVSGGAGADLLYGDEGDDLQEGGEGDDILPASDGRDDLWGGAGVDLATYQWWVRDISLTLDTLPNDGRPGENDHLHSDIENIDGADAKNVIVGNGGPNVLRASVPPPYQYPWATGGYDDVINGMGGNDTIHGYFGDDRLYGGDGDDEITSVGGRDRAEGGNGNDRIDIRDGEPAHLSDSAFCGPGADTVRADPNDYAAPDCEVVLR